MSWLADPRKMVLTFNGFSLKFKPLKFATSSLYLFVFLSSLGIKAIKINSEAKIWV